MGRTVVTNVQNHLDDDDAYTQTTLDMILTDASEYHYATDEFTGSNSIDYDPELRKASEIKQSIAASTDRVNVTIQNVDKIFGGELDVLSTEPFVKAVGIVGRQYGNPMVAGSAWVELFRGEVRPVGIDEKEVVLEILNDLAAAGFCVGHWSLAENCQFVYKHAGTCGFAGAAPSCNKRRRSPDGCSGKIVTGTTTNEFRFGGMEFPDSQASVPPSGGGDDDPGDWLPCPRMDQYVLVRGSDGLPSPKAVARLTLRDMLFHPIDGTFHEISKLTVVPDEPIMQLVADNYAASYSSYSHPIIRNRKDERGTPVEDLYNGYDILTWSKRLTESVVENVEETGKRADVLKIKMKDGHIYCSGNTPKKFVVCHNSKPPLDDPPILQ